MAASTPTFGSLSLALAQAITYLTRSLIVRYSATTIIKLQLALEANLTAQFAPSWVPTEPLRGSGRRCLTLSPSGTPPRPIYNACKSANVEWSDWIAALGGVEFDLFVDPGCISVRFGDWDSGKVGKFFTIWSEDTAAQTHNPLAMAKVQPKPTPLNSKTLAQQLLETDDDEEEQLFAMIADEMREPTWVTPIQTHFIQAPPRSPSPVSSIVSSDSRSSSSSSSSSSGYSLLTDSSRDSYGSAVTVSVYSTSSSPEKGCKMSRRERARQARIFVDQSKTEVTNYDGGKTTVLTGGVMLGGASVAPKAKPAHKVVSSSSNWRVRA